MKHSNHAWKLQDAKAKFSQLVDLAMTDGPQVVTRYGKDAVVLLSVEEYENLSSQKPSFNAFLLSAPQLTENELAEFERQKDYPREIDLG